MTDMAEWIPAIGVLFLTAFNIFVYLRQQRFVRIMLIEIEALREQIYSQRVSPMRRGIPDEYPYEND